MVAPRLHPWHDIPTGPDAPDLLTTVVEIPRYERNKYELDKTLGLYRLDRVLYSAVHFPGDYGFLPRTLGEDNDPLDVLVIMTRPTFTGCLVEVRPVGLFRLVDRGENDEKIIAVPMSDPYSEPIRDLDQVPPHLLREVEHFFRIYKDLEGKGVVESRGFGDRAAACQVIRDGMARYAGRFPGREPAAPER